MSKTTCPFCKNDDKLRDAFKLVWTQNPGFIMQQFVVAPKENIFFDQVGHPWNGRMLCDFLAQCHEHDYDLAPALVN